VYNDEWDLLVGDGARNWVRAILLIFVVYVFHVCLLAYSSDSSTAGTNYCHQPYHSTLHLFFSPCSHNFESFHAGEGSSEYWTTPASLGAIIGVHDKTTSQAVLQCAEPLGFVGTRPKRCKPSPHHTGYTRQGGGLCR
jgi:hypothetical protein